MRIQYSYLVAFYDGKKMVGQIWLNGCADSIQAEQSGRDMCNDRYTVKIIERDPG